MLIYLQTIIKVIYFFVIVVISLSPCGTAMLLIRANQKGYDEFLSDVERMLEGRWRTWRTL